MRPVPIAVLLSALTTFPATAQDDAEAACLAQAVYYEARGTSDTAQAAVAHVVLNRAEHPRFPDTACSVVEDGCQFSYMCDGKPETLADLDDRAAAVETAERVLEGELPDPTDGALYYHNDSVSPDWAERLDETTEIGGHVFYR